MLDDLYQQLLACDGLGRISRVEQRHSLDASVLDPVERLCSGQPLAEVSLGSLAPVIRSKLIGGWHLCSTRCYEMPAAVDSGPLLHRCVSGARHEHHE